ncbi:S8 family peptidase [Roseateles sp. DAIF2]|uniref:S8 family peptidase n=1 Tax=Roseateles sp. DAIF2 TaxID=2714952 RepID=UPI0018A2B219|nr:S8 family peptidase [Roseateles sp. DAIF2]QPF76031.1 S8 family peptidase [Roseateles sp. DAIF2]
MKRTSINWAALLLLSGAASLAAADDIRRPYIVQLADTPAASYTGGVAGYAATRPAVGSRLDVSAASVQAYISYLEGKRNQVLSTVSGANIVHRYSVAFNGFSALLTDAEARRLKSDPGVVAIEADVPRRLDTNYTPSFLGLDKLPNGLWAQLGGPTGAGEDIIIGVIDGGVWPENPSFADRVDANGKPTFDAAATLAYGPPPAHWKGECEAGEAFSADLCNNKLIGARAFSQTFLANVASGRLVKHPAEFLSPRDNGGHGTHTASTAGGNAKVDAKLDNTNVLVGGVSGIAPRARLSTYKVCWTSVNPQTTRPDARWPDYDNGCYGGDSIRAIEAAIEDGVHVLNYSISGSTTNIADSVDVAFKAAVDAGIFVAASAGNSGPTTSSTAHLGPWMTTVGNSTHDRLFTGTVTLGNGATHVGASSNPDTPSAPLILAENAGLDGLSASDQLRLKECFGLSDANAVVGGAAWSKKSLLDPNKVRGKLLVCNRGNNVLVNKSANAKAAGAAGVVIANVAGFANTIVNQGHTVSTVHVAQADGDAIKAYMAANAANATGSLGNLQAIKDQSVAAPAMNDGSSRGFNAGNPSIMKPDLTAPGTSILAGYTPDYTIAEHDQMIATGQAGRPNYSMLSGTSMSSPHVAGLAALLRHKYPSWSPAAIRSALMTTGMDVFNTLTGLQQGRLPWGQGAGFVQPNNAADPGLIYDIAPIDYNRFLCGVGQAGVVASVGLQPGVNCGTTGSIVATDLNLPSLTSGSVLGIQVFNRKVTNVGAAAATYTASASVPGFTTVVTPSSLTLNPGETKSFQVRLTRTTAAQGAWNYGSLVWTDGSHVVRSPLTARASLVAAPALQSSDLAAGNKIFPIGTGFDGAMGVVKGGLKDATRTPLTVTGVNRASQLPTLGAACLAGGAGMSPFNVVIPAGALAARFMTFSAETSGGQAGLDDDLDMVMINSTGGVVGYSGNNGSSEEITLVAPAAGTYRVCTIGYSHAAGANSTNYTLSSWVVTPADNGGNFAVSLPSRAYVGRTATAGLSWSGLAPGGRYLAAASYQVGGASAGATTLLVVNTDAPVATNAAITAGREAGQAAQ